MTETAADVRFDPERTPDGRVLVAVPAWAMQQAWTRVRLEVEGPTAISATPLVIEASLSAPGLVVEPPGEQRGPLADWQEFQWSIAATGTGRFRVSPSLSVLGEQGIDESRLIWARSFDLDVVSPLGLSKDEAAAIAIGSGGGGAALAVVVLRGQSRWKQPTKA